ncbi:hypothetical protein GUJ93_ZPchr0004g38374 [Zizania palustris]|uniref:Uncharacterized protein n=1 Tax=Zizania palustris TaxID=103762 RepID=A0A8J5SG22_ZIZPA|nr:hypothetical protein GUJ93_ZPchr0004g38374 [Zizania palustris]
MGPKRQNEARGDIHLEPGFGVLRQGRKSSGLRRPSKGDLEDGSVKAPKGRVQILLRRGDITRSRSASFATRYSLKG